MPAGTIRARSKAHRRQPLSLRADDLQRPRASSRRKPEIEFGLAGGDPIGRDRLQRRELVDVGRRVHVHNPPRPLL